MSDRRDRDAVAGGRGRESGAPAAGLGPEAGLPSPRFSVAPLRLLNLGYGNLVVAARVVAIVSPQSSPMRRLRREAARRGKLVDATEGRRTRSILMMDSDHVILSAINPETIAARLLQEEPGAGEG